MEEHNKKIISLFREIRKDDLRNMKDILSPYYPIQNKEAKRMIFEIYAISSRSLKESIKRLTKLK